MTLARQGLLGASLIIALGAATGTVTLQRTGLVDSAQAQPASDDEKRRKEREKLKEKGSLPPPKGAPPPPPKASPPPEKKAVTPQFQQVPPAAKLPGPPPPEPKKDTFKRLPPPDKGPPPPPERKAVTPQFQQVPPAAKLPGPKPGDPPPLDPKKDTFKRLPPPDKGPPPPPERKAVTPQFQQVPPAAKLPGPKPGDPPPPDPKKDAFKRLPPPDKGPAPKLFSDVQKGRLERVEDGGKRKVIQEPGNRIIIKQDNRIIIRHDEAERFRRRPGARTEQRPDGRVETYYVRPDGVRIISEVDAGGRLLRRYRRAPDGREWSIIDNRRFYGGLAVGAGIGIGIGIIALNLPPPRVTIERERYIVEYERASDDDLDETLMAPPLERLERPYALEEIRSSYELRARMRRIDLDTIHFESGAWEVTPDQYYKLERVARAILRVLRFNPDALVLVEGHTDLVGSDIDNLSLSDRRAASVAEVLSETFGVPPENLVTQGYGEQHPKIDVQGPEPLNRRVSILNITGLMAER